jgi:ATP-dependent Clp protease ATP-binding subunit ClpA
MIESMFHRFTDSARRTVFFARDQALTSHEVLIRPDHLLLGLIQLHPELFEETVHSADALRVCRELEARSERSAAASNPADARFSDELKRVLRNADDEAAGFYKRNTGARARLLRFLTMSRWVVEPCHLLLGLLRERDCPAAKALIERGITLQASRERVLQWTCRR